jgi:hypothetical protein
MASKATFKLQAERNLVLVRVVVRNGGAKRLTTSARKIFNFSMAARNKPYCSSQWRSGPCMPWRNPPPSHPAATELLQDAV